MFQRTCLGTKPFSVFLPHASSFSLNCHNWYMSQKSHNIALSAVLDIFLSLSSSFVLLPVVSLLHTKKKVVKVLLNS